MFEYMDPGKISVFDCGGDVQVHSIVLDPMAMVLESLSELWALCVNRKAVLE